MNTLHILHLQFVLHSDLSLDIVCIDEPMASLDEKTRILTIELPRDIRGPQSVRFLARDPSTDKDKHVEFHATMLSGPPSQPKTQWYKDGDESRSPYFPAETSVEVWATVLAVPQGDPNAAKVYHGRRNVVVTPQGGGDLRLFNG